MEFLMFVIFKILLKDNHWFEQSIKLSFGKRPSMTLVGLIQAATIAWYDGRTANIQ
jgi:hypothetical protein